MSIDTAIAAIRSRALSLWPALDATVPLAWPNDPFPPPVDASGNALPWVLIEVRWSGGGFESIGSPGSNLARRLGHIWVFAFIGRGTGEDRAHQLAARAAGMFEGQDFSGIVCHGMGPGGEADSESGAYFGQSACVPFDYDETA